MSIIHSIYNYDKIACVLQHANKSSILLSVIPPTQPLSQLHSEIISIIQALQAYMSDADILIRNLYLSCLDTNFESSRLYEYDIHDIINHLQYYINHLPESNPVSNFSSFDTSLSYNDISPLLSQSNKQDRIELEFPPYSYTVLNKWKDHDDDNDDDDDVWSMTDSNEIQQNKIYHHIAIPSFQFDPTRPISLYQHKETPLSGSSNRVNAVNTAKTINTINAVNTAKTVNTINTVNTAKTINTINTVNTVNTTNTTNRETTQKIQIIPSTPSIQPLSTKYIDTPTKSIHKGSNKIASPTSVILTDVYFNPKELKPIKKEKLSPPFLPMKSKQQLGDDEDYCDSSSSIEIKPKRGRPRKDYRKTRSRPKLRWCHQCKARKRDVIQCSGGKSRGMNHQLCKRAYCSKCLKKHYNEDIRQIKQKGKRWICPGCREICSCAACVRKRYSDPRDIPESLKQQRNSRFFKTNNRIIQHLFSHHS